MILTPLEWCKGSWLRKEDKKKIKALVRIYRKIDRNINKFKKATGLHCLDGCGRCCETDKIEATILELMPLAVLLWEKGEAQKWFDKIVSQEESLQCVFFDKQLLETKGGGCGVYPFRPVVCRLFGFSAMRGKRGEDKFMKCSVMKATQATELNKVKMLIDKEKFVPVMVDYMAMIFGLDPINGRKRIPINEAIKNALEIVGLSFKFKGRLGKRHFFS